MSKKAKAYTEGTFRVGGRVTQDLNNQIDALAKELSLSKMAIMSLIITIGFKSLSRTVNPEEYLDWEKISTAFEGASLDKPMIEIEPEK